MTFGADLPRFSVIVCSWQRPSWLKRCLRALLQLDYPAFEIVVVADPSSLSKITISEPLKLIAFHEPNLAMARNAGVAASGGDICAFIDDDAVPEPMWLIHLAAGFDSTGASAAVGHVRGRNGISFQSKVTTIDCEAETHVAADVGQASVPTLPLGHALKLVGTNMAIRRNVFVELGGFDPLYRYFLEDADFSIRLCNAGHLACVVPDAEVHHSFASSSRRTNYRAPLSLYDIGRSTAIFLRRHYSGDTDEIRARTYARERMRLLRHMVRGTCEPRDIRRILTTLSEGWVDGAEEPLSACRKIEKIVQFKPVSSNLSEHIVRTSRFLLNRRRAVRAAQEVAETGTRISLFSFSLTPVRHHLSYTSEGVWLQTGGVFGRSERTQPLVRWCRFAKRQKEERARVAIARGLRD